MTLRADAEAGFLRTRKLASRLVGTLIAQQLAEDAEALDRVVELFVAKTGWPERTARIVLEGELRKAKLSLAELEIETARLLRRIGDSTTPQRAQPAPRREARAEAVPRS